MRKFDTKNIEHYENIFSNLNEEDQKLLEKIREKLAMKKIESSEDEISNEQEESEEKYFDDSETSMNSRKSEELTIDFQISKQSKQKNENSQVKDSPKIIRKEKINRESEVQPTSTDVENSANTQKKARYEDGTWKFF